MNDDDKDAMRRDAARALHAERLRAAQAWVEGMTAKLDMMAEERNAPPAMPQVAVDAAMKAMGCEPDGFAGRYCAIHQTIVERMELAYDAGSERPSEWTERGCEYAEHVAGAVVAGLRDVIQRDTVGAKGARAALGLHLQLFREYDPTVGHWGRAVGDWGPL